MTPFNFIIEEGRVVETTREALEEFEAVMANALLSFRSEMGERPTYFVLGREEWVNWRGLVALKCRYRSSPPKPPTFDGIFVLRSSLEKQLTAAVLPL